MGGGGRAYPETPGLGVGAVVLTEDSLLLVRRGQPPKEGDWIFPGGLEGGNVICSMDMRGFRSSAESSSESRVWIAIFFFFAAMMPLRDAYRGTFNPF